jgi:hypothetical protein
MTLSDTTGKAKFHEDDEDDGDDGDDEVTEDEGVEDEGIAEGTTPVPVGPVPVGPESDNIAGGEGGDLLRPNFFSIMSSTASMIIAKSLLCIARSCR